MSKVTGRPTQRPFVPCGVFRNKEDARVVAYDLSGIRGVYEATKTKHDYAIVRVR